MFQMFLVFSFEPPFFEILGLPLNMLSSDLICTDVLVVYCIIGFCLYTCILYANAIHYM